MGVIHGITAKYYRAKDVEIRLGMENSEFRTEREIIAENQVMLVFRAFTESVNSCDETEYERSLHGDCYTGVIHLTEPQFSKLREDMMRFIRENRSPSDGTTPYEFALVYSNRDRKK